MSARLVDLGVALGLAAILPPAIRLVPLPLVLRACDSFPSAGSGGASPDGLAARARRLLGSGVGPWRSTCLTRSTVLYALMRYHGYQPRFMIGVRGAHEAFGAHAWVALGEMPVSDAAGSDYTPIMSHGR